LQSEVFLLLHALAVDIPRVPGHPNRSNFCGVLTLVDTPSDRSPAGARGHRVILTRTAAEKALASLIGMGIDYTPGMDGHDARRKVGIITSAEIVGRELVVSGYLFGRDFADVVAAIEQGGQQLGMSYELANAEVEDISAGIWRITDAVFTGAAVLFRHRAAYQNTSIEMMEAA
jgi:hypothetical protein